MVYRIINKANRPGMRLGIQGRVNQLIHATSTTSDTKGIIPNQVVAGDDDVKHQQFHRGVVEVDVDAHRLSAFGRSFDGVLEKIGRGSPELWL